MPHPVVPRTTHRAVRRPFASRLALAATLACASFAALAQSGVPAGRWACDLNGRDLDIRIAGDEATVTIAGGGTRVLKRRDVRSGAYYTDGSVALKHRGGDPAPANDPQWVQNGEASSLRRCMPAAG